MSRKSILLTFLLAGIATVGVVAAMACGGGNNDAVGKEFMPTMDAAVDDLDDFWNDFLDDQGYGRYYESPKNVEFYSPTEPQQTPCGETIPNNAFYCPPNNSIYFDEVFLENEFNKGAYAPVYIAAHEWGHLVQQGLGILSSLSFSIQVELQADCFAGVYTRDLDEDSGLTTENLLEAVATLISVGDPLLIPWWAPSAHGDPADRVAAYTIGYNEGWDACITEGFPAPRVEQGR